ncbi:MAG: 50S ribosomal protein L1 [Candidatus Woesearchaeota archaeon]
MDQKSVLKVLLELKSQKKRNFAQSYDLIINLKNLDLKKPDQQIELFVNLHNTVGKKRKVGVFVAQELLQQAQQVSDKVVFIDDFPNYQDKKSIKRLAKDIDFFVAQATIMPKVALQFGKVLGPRAKMPNPKLGCVVPPQANLKALVDKLQKVIVVKVKTQPVVQVMVGTESMPDAEVVDNIMTVYGNVVSHLPSEKNNIKSIYLKTTMGKPFRLDAEKQSGRAEKKQEKSGAHVAGEQNAQVSHEKKSSSIENHDSNEVIGQ